MDFVDEVQAVVEPLLKSLGEELTEDQRTQLRRVWKAYDDVSSVDSEEREQWVGDHLAGVENHMISIAISGITRVILTQLLVNAPDPPTAYGFGFKDGMIVAAMLLSKEEV